MVLLPLVYFTIIASFGTATWYWAFYAPDLLFPPSGGGSRHVFFGTVIIYIAVLGAGISLTLFMLKSLLPAWHMERESHPISHLDHPLIFRFLGELCQLLGAPIPSRVDVNLEINASAGLRGGFRSLRGNDILLTFGLPLVAALTREEFAAVMSHELGHLTQRSALKFYFIIHSIHGWLYRAVFTRDGFDEWLEEASNYHALSLLTFGLVRLMVAITRGVMWLLLCASHALTSYLSRQMEFHADECAASISGSETFVRTNEKIHLLGVCFQRSVIQFKNRIAARYPDDISTWLAIQVRESSGQLRGHSLQSAAAEKAHWYSSHPSDLERNRRVLDAGYPGAIQDAAPATTLFNGFEELSRTLTLASYENSRRGRSIPEDQIFAVRPAPPEPEEETVEIDESPIARYFGGLGSFSIPVTIEPSAKAKISLPSLRAGQLRQARESLTRSELPDLCRKHEEVETRLREVLRAQALASSGISIDATMFPAIATDLADLPSSIASLNGHREALRASLAPYQTAASTRLTTALGILRDPLAKLPMPERRPVQEKVEELSHAFGNISSAMAELRGLQDESCVLAGLLQARDEIHSELADAGLANSIETCRGHLTRLRAIMGSTAYPFPHAKGRISMGEYMEAKEYNPDPARMLQLEVQSHLRRGKLVYTLILSRLASVAEQLEQAIHA